MKLGNLKSAIRNAKPGVTMEIPLPGGQTMRCWLVKGTLIDELSRVYGSGKATETGLSLDETGFLSADRPAVRGNGGGNPPAGVTVGSAYVIVKGGGGQVDLEDYIAAKAPTPSPISDLDDLLG